MKINIKEYKEIIGKKTNIHKVSYFFKKDVKDLFSKKILLLDLEFSKNYHIFEVGAIILEKGNITNTLFKKYKLPKNESYWDFETNSFTNKEINKNKKEFSKKDGKELLELIESVDYIVVHNYTAEAQCIAKIKNKEYKAETCDILQEEKFICTNYSFKNKYFKEKGIEKTSNSEISNYFGWKIKDKEKEYILKNGKEKIKIEKPKGVKSELHNSFYDVVITLSNFISLSKMV